MPVMTDEYYLVLVDEHEDEISNRVPAEFDLDLGDDTMTVVLRFADDQRLVASRAANAHIALGYQDRFTTVADGKDYEIEVPRYMWRNEMAVVVLPGSVVSVVA